jgi:hypothetical protein
VTRASVSRARMTWIAAIYVTTIFAIAMCAQQSGPAAKPKGP